MLSFLLDRRLVVCLCVLCTSASGQFATAQATKSSEQLTRATQFQPRSTLRLRFMSSTGQPNSGVANVVVRLDSAPKKPKAQKKPVKGMAPILTLSNRRFNQLVTVVQPKQQLQIVNSDGHGYNLTVNGFHNHSFNLIVHPNDSNTISLDRLESTPVAIESNIHPSARAWLVVTDDDRIGVSDSNGDVFLKDLEAGELQLQVWHPEIGRVPLRRTKDLAQDKSIVSSKRGQLSVQLEPGENNLGSILLAPF